MKKKLFAAATCLVFGTGSAHAMDVATYLARAEALRARGWAAMLSSDFRALQAEIDTSAAALRQERLAAERAGRRPAYCPTGRVSFSREEIFAAMAAVPPAQRPRTQVRDALRAAFARRFPCGRCG